MDEGDDVGEGGVVGDDVGEVGGRFVALVCGGCEIVCGFVGGRREGGVGGGEVDGVDGWRTSRRARWLPRSCLRGGFSP